MLLVVGPVCGARLVRSLAIGIIYRSLAWTRKICWPVKIGEQKFQKLSTPVTLWSSVYRRNLTKQDTAKKVVRLALDAADEQPDGTIFLIPLKLEEQEVPERLSRWQWVNYFEDGGYQNLMRSLQARARDLGIDRSQTLVQHRPDPAFYAMEQTMSNPHYISDLHSFELNDDLSTIMNSDTILIVVGTWLPAELCDRPVAERLRDEIDKRGNNDPFRRGIVLTDMEWFANNHLSVHPAISVGGPFANALTKELLYAAPESGRWTTKRLGGSFIAGPPPRATVWGHMHAT